MFRIARLFVTLSAGRLGDVRDRIGHRLGFLILVAALGLVFAAFGLAAITAALASALGVVAALSIMTFVFFCALAGAVAMMVVVDQRDRARLAQKAALQNRLSQAAMIAAMGAAQGGRLRFGRVLGLGIFGAAALFVLAAVADRGGDDADDGGRS